MLVLCASFIVAPFLIVTYMTEKAANTYDHEKTLLASAAGGLMQRTEVYQYR